MKILALQLKRIGDLVLTTPALSAIKAWRPECHVALAVHQSTAGLLPVIPHFDAAVVFGPGRGWSPWQQVLTGHFDAVVDFTGTDRSALATRLSRAERRVTFEWVRRKGLRRLAYTDFVESSVRERRTVDHYLDLTRALTGYANKPATEPHLEQSAADKISRPAGKYVVLHPFTARPEKNWPSQAWGAVARHCRGQGLAVLLTGGDSPAEHQHHQEVIEAAGDPPIQSGAGKTDLQQLCGSIAGAELVISCDTGAVHIAAAYQRPQIALFGPTNPFHWRPRHKRAIILSATQPEAPMTNFDPRMKGAPMDRISTDSVCRAIDALLAK